MNWNFQPGIHPDADQLSVFVEGVTAAREQKQMLAHLAQCAECRKAVFLMQPHEEPQQVTATPVKGWVWRWLVPVGLPAAALACVIAMFVYIRPRGGMPLAPQQTASARQPETESPETLAAPSSDLKQGASTTNAGSASMNSEQVARSEGRPNGLAAKATTNAPPRESQMASGSNLSPSKSGPMTAEVEPPKVLSPAPSPMTIGGPIGGVAVEAGKGSGGGIGSGAGAGTALRMQTSQAAAQNRSVERKDLPALQNQTGQDEALVALSGMLAGVSGRITDQTGAVVVGATVTLRDASGKTRQTTTGTDGSFHLTELPAGQYEVTATASGFKTSKQTIELQPSELAMLQPKLDVGAASETVEVAASSATLQVQTESASVAGAVTEKEATSLAVNGRNFTQLISLAPGMTTVSHGKRFLSLDSAGNLSRSHDKGKKWKKVNPQWAGKAVRIELTPAYSSDAPPPAKNETGPASKGAIFQLTTDTGAIWTSKDGTHWHQQ